MSSPVASDVTARVQFTVTESWNGGPIVLGPQFLTTLHAGDSYFMVRLMSIDGQNIGLGKPVDVTVEFFSAATALPNFPEGAQFKIWAGKDIGIGEVLAVGGTSNKSLERTREG